MFGCCNKEKDPGSQEAHARLLRLENGALGGADALDYGAMPPNPVAAPASRNYDHWWHLLCMLLTTYPVLMAFRVQNKSVDPLFAVASIVINAFYTPKYLVGVTKATGQAIGRGYKLYRHREAWSWKHLVYGLVMLGGAYLALCFMGLLAGFPGYYVIQELSRNDSHFHDQEPVFNPWFLLLINIMTTQDVMKSAHSAALYFLWYEDYLQESKASLVELKQKLDSALMPCKPEHFGWGVKAILFPKKARRVASPETEAERIQLMRQVWPLRPHIPLPGFREFPLYPLEPTSYAFWLGSVQSVVGAIASLPEWLKSGFFGLLKLVENHRWVAYVSTWFPNYYFYAKITWGAWMLMFILPLVRLWKHRSEYGWQAVVGTFLTMTVSFCLAYLTVEASVEQSGNAGKPGDFLGWLSMIAAIAATMMVNMPTICETPREVTEMCLAIKTDVVSLVWGKDQTPSDAGSTTGAAAEHVSDQEYGGHPD